METGVKENVGAVQERWGGSSGPSGGRSLQAERGDRAVSGWQIWDGSSGPSGGRSLQAEEEVGKRVLWELMAIGFADVRDFLAVEQGALVIRDTGELSHSQTAAVASMEKTGGGVKLKFYDKLKALELLGRHYGLFEGGGTGGGESNLLGALLQKTREEVETSDIPELQQAPESCHDLVEPEEPECL